jgi:hypothetical protein
MKPKKNGIWEDVDQFKKGDATRFVQAPIAKCADVKIMVKSLFSQRGNRSRNRADSAPAHEEASRKSAAEVVNDSAATQGLDIAFDDDEQVDHDDDSIKSRAASAPDHEEANGEFAAEVLNDPLVSQQVHHDDDSVESRAASAPAHEEADRESVAEVANDPVATQRTQELDIVIDEDDYDVDTAAMNPRRVTCEFENNADAALSACMGFHSSL